ncbi:MAG TPA: SET domain-containing protein-lysine N-methyltransferase [Kofleriaceae bacterium]|nr:SET domain-containing protein-lysine N-methyltransferase [Kofleriaceae bacterium]
MRSTIHGYGVVTTRAFAAGELVCVGDGVLYREDDEFDDTYALILDGPTGETVLWDLVDQTRWFNHSCAPNTEVRSRWDDAARELRAWWVALRDIAPGEEITYDYGFVAEVAEPCACGAATCRGVIVEDEPAQIARLPDQLRALLRRGASGGASVTLTSPIVAPSSTLASSSDAGGRLTT